MAASIRRFAAHHGKSDKYHETVTQAWMQLVADAAKSAPDLESLLKSLDKTILAEYYSETVLQSDAARTTFIAPDRKPLP